MDGLNYAIKTRKYSHMISCYKTYLEVLGDNDTKGYAFVLQHCPEELQAELKNQEVWVAINDARGDMRLLILIRDLQHNKSDRKRSIMTPAKASYDLYSCAQGGKTKDEYY